MEIALYNLAHSVDRPALFRIGPFNIVIDEGHIERVKLIPYPSVDHFFQDGEKIVHVRIDEQHGEWCNTAKAVINDCDLLPSLLDVFSQDDLSYDLVSLLSFITCRRVVRGKDVESITNFPNPGTLPKLPIDQCILDECWRNINKIKIEKLVASFAALLKSYDSVDMLFMGVCVSASLNLAYDLWWAKSSNGVNVSFKNSLEGKIVQLIQAELAGAQYNVVADNLSNRVKTLFNVTALDKLRKFLIENEMFPVNGNGAMKRLRWINLVRNALVHRGCAPHEIHKDMGKAYSLSCGCLAICGDIMWCYFASILIGDSSAEVSRVKSNIMRFFKDGVYNGVAVYDETYADYVDRLYSRWESDGIAPWDTLA